jgi:4-hydroxybenzoate polyprenyltransferase
MKIVNELKELMDLLVEISKEMSIWKKIALGMFVLFLISLIVGILSGIEIIKYILLVVAVIYFVCQFIDADKEFRKKYGLKYRWSERKI